MICISKDIDSNACTIFEVIKAYWADSLLRTNDKNYKYYWWWVNYRKKLIICLQKKWTSNLPEFSLFNACIEDLREKCNPINYGNSELYLAMLIKMTDDMNKLDLKGPKRLKKI